MSESKSISGESKLKRMSMKVDTVPDVKVCVSHVMWCHVMSCHVVSCELLSHVMSCELLCHVSCCVV